MFVRSALGCPIAVWCCPTIIGEQNCKAFKFMWWRHPIPISITSNTLSDRLVQSLDEWSFESLWSWLGPQRRVLIQRTCEISTTLWLAFCLNSVMSMRPQQCYRWLCMWQEDSFGLESAMSIYSLTVLTVTWAYICVLWGCFQQVSSWRTKRATFQCLCLSRSFCALSGGAVGAQDADQAGTVKHLRFKVHLNFPWDFRNSPRHVAILMPEPVGQAITAVIKR